MRSSLPHPLLLVLVELRHCGEESSGKKKEPRGNGERKGKEGRKERMFERKQADCSLREQKVGTVV